MSNQFKTKEFKKLNKLWYGKLKKEGFEDIERKDKTGQKEERVVNSPLHYIAKNYTLLQFEVKEEYYRMAGQFLHEHKFKSLYEREVWELHSNGVSIRNIVKKLKARKQTAYRDLVHGVIKALVTEMKTNARKR